MPCFFWYVRLHFRRSVAILRWSSGIFVKSSSHTGSTVQPLVADDADVQLAALDVALDQRVGADRSRG